ncbi:MAG: PD-(D/E)XK nuclease family transposase [Lachnospiraceae bacterium]
METGRLIWRCRWEISVTGQRSVFYLCKMFTDLEQGEDYTDTKTSVHIGILNRTPLPEDAAFYNEYALLNRKTGDEFNGKFILRVLDLSYLDKVTEERNTPYPITGPAYSRLRRGRS